MKIKNILFGLFSCFLVPTVALATDRATALAICQTDAQFYTNIHEPTFQYSCVDQGTRSGLFDGRGNPMGCFVMMETEAATGRKVPMAGPCYIASGNFVLTITSELSKIPSLSGVDRQGKVLTKSLLTLSVKKNSQSAPGKQIHLSSSRGQYIDSLMPSTGVLVTNASGNASASISTRVQPGTSTVTAIDSDIQTNTPNPVSWFPARYENSFLVTCYTIGNEADAPSTPTSTNVCGLPEENSYRSRFLQDVRMQGSGVTLDGTTIHFNANQSCYNVDVCARTATGVCAVAGTTIAVDFTVIPKRSTVSVGILGQRKARDTGGRITGYHIDDYVGAQPALCRKLGLRQSDITLLNY